METNFKIGGYLIKVDIASTEALYKTQNRIIDDCNCQDCDYYAKNFISFPFKAFDILKETGIDLSKNLNSEPTGVQCIRDDYTGTVINISQTCQITGKIMHDSLNQIRYSIQENGFSFNLFFLQSSKDIIDI